MTPCLIDSGFLYALIDKRDQHSTRVKASLETVFEEIILPVPAITEAAYFVAKNLGSISLADFVNGLDEMNMIVECPLAQDYSRSAKIFRKYKDANIDFVDACIVAMAERLNITKILTVDRRHFQMFRPLHCESFEILP